MEVMSYTKLRNNLASPLESVNINTDSILITIQNYVPAVLMSFKDYESYAKTEYLLANPVNAEELNKWIQAVRKGRVKKYDLIELWILYGMKKQEAIICIEWKQIKTNNLLKDIANSAFEGIVKPKPLRKKFKRFLVKYLLLYWAPSSSCVT